jgi:hypothetical protein
MVGWIDKYGWMNGWISMDGWMDGLMDGSGRSMGEWGMNGCTCIYMDRWDWMDGWMDWWMDSLFIICNYIAPLQGSYSEALPTSARLRITDGNGCS